MNNFFIFSAKYLFALPVIILGWYFLRSSEHSKKNMTVFALSALAVTYLTSLVCGHFYFDPRPFVVGHFIPLIPHAPDNGFPSDHALLTSALAMVGIFWNKKLGIILWILALIISVARVYVGVHHPVDVIGSMVISIIIISLIYLIFKHVLHKEII